MRDAGVLRHLACAHCVRGRRVACEECELFLGCPCRRGTKWEAEGPVRCVQTIFPLW